MKKALCIASAIFLCAATADIAAAGWNSCSGCHNGSLAPDKAKLLERHKTVEKFVKAAQTTNSPLMQSIKTDEKLLREIAQEIGLK